MQTLQAFTLLPVTNEATFSQPIFLGGGGGNDITLEVFGDATGFALEFQGKCEEEKIPWSKLMVTNLNDFTTTNSIIKTGIYKASLIGLSVVRVELKSITTGVVDVYCRLTK
ncbi:MAG: hypothetical protein WCO84_01320 [bacterium]